MHEQCSSFRQTAPMHRRLNITPLAQIADLFQRVSANTARVACCSFRFTHTALLMAHIFARYSGSVQTALPTALIFDRYSGLFIAARCLSRTPSLFMGLPEPVNFSATFLLTSGRFIGLFSPIHPAAFNARISGLFI